MNTEVREYFNLLSAACGVENTALGTAYRQLRELLEHLCRTQMADSSLQMTDLSARINFVAAKLGLSVVEQNRLHTFRLTSNAVLNRQSTPVREQLLRDAKTLSFFVKRLTGEDIPAELYRLLPCADATYITAPMPKERVRRMRVSFQYADDTFLYVLPVDTVVDEPLRVRYNVPQVNDEFAGTCSVLWRHARVNLLDVVVDEQGVLTPSFIVLEPDYLLDISTLAECFREYGHHPANYMLARLQASGSNTRPLLLGNIANLFLDEWIHAEGEPDYMTCMKKAFRTYPIELAACADLRDREKEREFFTDCKRHFDHIRQTVTETFLAAGYELDKTDAVLEPSYICEALGLQGRLDYMQRDMSSFIEMKSGKADEYAIRGKVEPKENNKVQMLLYQAVLEYAMGKDHRRVKSYLLYTRYPLLYPARPSWAMLRRVMDVRNRIVANEYGIQLHNSLQYTAERLQDIRPEILNERKLDNVLWKRYLHPSINTVTQKLRTLSPLEQAYFYALYNFITKELYTSKSGDTDYEGRAGAAALWLSTLAEKSGNGEILYDLVIRQNGAADVHRPYLVLERMHKDTGVLPNFRQGDAVVLYERNTAEDNVTCKMVFKGNIEHISDSDVRIRLRAAQQNAGVLPVDSRYAIEHDYMDTSFRSMYGGLAAFLDATKERRDLLLNRRPPVFDTSLDSAIAAAPDDFARITLKARAAGDYFLLVGPPGTGKTSRALRSMVEAFYREGKEILLLSYTNRAVDEICKMLVTITPEVDFIRIGSELSCDGAYRPYLIGNILEPCSTRREVQERMARCRIFVGTVATLSSRSELFRLKTFDVALIDEATQILEPQLLGLLCMRGASGGNAIGKFILIGDHKQLPAVVLQSPEQSEVHDEGLRGIGLYNLKDSLFERLYRSITGRQAAECLESPVSEHSFSSFRSLDMLCRQGRMNVEVAAFPNHAFYGGLLQPVGLEHQTGTLELSPGLSADEFAGVFTRRVAFIPSVPEPPMQSVKVNHSEAGIVARLAAAVYRQYASAEKGFDAVSTLGIITPYRSQIALIKKEIAAMGSSVLNDVLVDTVERFQGSERDVIIYSFCVNRAYQLRFLANLTEENGVQIDRKLNVALTRARRQMFITGVPRLLEQNPIYCQLLKSCGL